MHIAEYFQQIEDIISSFPAIVCREISLDQRTHHIGIIKGILTFSDSSELHFKEFIDVDSEVIKYKYAYHYQKDNKLVFRYDNHPISLNDIPQYHKHDRSEENIVESHIPDLQNILKEIVGLLPER